MRVAVECKSPLLQKSLEIFLTRYLSSSKQCDILIRDEECLEDTRCFYISSASDSDLTKPFSKSQLILSLENKYQTLSRNIHKKKEEVIDIDEPLNFDILENRIDFLTQEYKENILKAVKAFYEK
ncbi:hypothetical protein JHD48_01055 [Sulfurimonas sp. SAG-AH-194-I05]|nr:hypothetical protein [Sulfurimonas sp. SAG-AH-194-I05]MDF1874316.1 hypothetical protein [Sulfurimonas sp. SAG-AH-194-I05]